MTDAQIPVHGQPAETIEPGQQPNAPAAPENRGQQLLREIMGGSFVVSLLAVVIGLLAGAILIVLTDSEVQTTAGYFFARPGDLFAAIGNAIGGSYVALFEGAIFNPTRPTFVDQIKPLSDTLAYSTPLIAAGLGVAVGFRVGLFNIGGQGQILVAAAVAGWISWSFPMPFFLHMIVATIGGIIGGAIWAGIAGFLKARTGAHEVILTIMLNFIALQLISYLLRMPWGLQNPNSNNPQSPATPDTAVMPSLSDLFAALGINPPGSFRVTVGFLFVIGATIFVWWLINRSSTGFKFRAVGENPNAARVAGIDVSKVVILALVVSGALIGLAGSYQVLAATTSGFSASIASSIGFDAITVALLGRSKPWGVFAAGLLFAALKSGGYTMQVVQQVPIDVVLVVQSVIVLFIAAPPLVRTIFRLPTPGAPRAKAAAATTTTAKAVAK